MKSMWIALVLIRERSSSPTEVAYAFAEREVAGRVLVEQRVEEGDARLADPALAVDERDLAEP